MRLWRSRRCVVANAFKVHGPSVPHLDRYFREITMNIELVFGNDVPINLYQGSQN
jgi:hypothetical protein